MPVKITLLKTCDPLEGRFCYLYTTEGRYLPIVIQRLSCFTPLLKVKGIKETSKLVDKKSFFMNTKDRVHISILE
jgi:hypothetical protein